MRKVKKYRGSTTEIDCYTDKDLVTGKVSLRIAQAENLWKAKCQEFLESGKNDGTCVLSAGIEVDYIGKGCRNADRKMVIRAGRVSPMQGASSWEYSVQEILDFLKEGDIKAYYNPGRMD